MITDNPPQGKGTGSCCAPTGNEKPPATPGFWFPFNRETGKGLPRHLRAAAETLELRYQDRCYTWANAKLLAQDHGLRTERGWHKLDKQLIAAGWLKTFTLHRGNKKYTIRVALKRLHQGRGVFDEKDGCWECLVKDARARVTHQGELGLCAECAGESPRTPVPKSPNSSSKSPRTPVRSLSTRLPFPEFEKEKQEKEKLKSTTKQGGSWESPAREAAGPAPSSSSQERRTGLEELRTTDASIDDPVVAELLDQAVNILTGERPAELPGKIRAAIQAGNPAWWIRDALVAVKRMIPRDGGKRHWGMVLRVLANFRLEGKPLEEPAHPPDPNQASRERNCATPDFSDSGDYPRVRPDAIIAPRARKKPRAGKPAVLVNSGRPLAADGNRRPFEQKGIYIGQYRR